MLGRLVKSPTRHGLRFDTGPGPVSPPPIRPWLADGDDAYGGEGEKMCTDVRYAGELAGKISQGDDDSRSNKMYSIRLTPRLIKSMINCNNRFL